MNKHTCHLLFHRIFIKGQPCIKRYVWCQGNLTARECFISSKNVLPAKYSLLRSSSFFLSPIFYFFSPIKESLCSIFIAWQLFAFMWYLNCYVRLLHWLVQLRWRSDGKWNFQWLFRGINKPEVGIHAFQDLIELALEGCYLHGSLGFDLATPWK